MGMNFIFVTDIANNNHEWIPNQERLQMIVRNK